jgi:LysM repeat protein
MKHTALFFTLLLLCFCAGCITGVPHSRKQAVRRETQFSGLKGEVDRISRRVEALHESQQNLYGQVESMDSTQRQRLDRMENRLDELDKAVSSIQDRQVRLKSEIVDELTGRMASLLEQTGSSGPEGYMQGREHVVRSGQTLSEIAAAYGVTVKAIVEANELENPDNIREGRELFIPE